MSCAFDLDHYARDPAAAHGRRLRFAHFEGLPRTGDVLLRHDVDLSLDAALRMAELEHEEGAAATYFLMTESVFYNLASSEGERARSSGCASSATGSGCTPSTRRPPVDARFDPVVAWHNPDPRVHERAARRRPRQCHAGAVVRPGHVPVGLEPALALRMPARGARARRVPVAAGAHPPGDLGLSGGDDGPDDARDARRRAGAAARAARRRPDRPGVSEIPLGRRRRRDIGDERRGPRRRHGSPARRPAHGACTRCCATSRRSASTARHVPRGRRAGPRGAVVRRGRRSASAVPRGMTSSRSSGYSCAACTTLKRVRALPDGMMAAGPVALTARSSRLPQRPLPAERILRTGCRSRWSTGTSRPAPAPLRRRLGRELLGASRPDGRPGNGASPDYRAGSACDCSATHTASTRRRGRRCSTSWRIATGSGTRSHSGDGGASAGQAGARCGTRAAGTRSSRASAWFEARRADLRRSLA